MRVQQVSAQSFGPLTGQSLDLADGLTVVWGLNEAGKSSWHSALHVALCGLRRGRGRGTSAETEFVERRRPWNGTSWKVGARVALDRGEVLTIQWDLDTKTAQILDALGRDRSNEWITDGAADLAKLVGLDRDTFLATACVRQADLLSVADRADKLQEVLQRAAATGGVDATAAAALETIRNFRQTHVGLDRANSGKPLPAAKREHELAKLRLEEAERDHEELLDLVTQVHQLDDRLTQSTTELELTRLVAEVQAAHLVLTEVHGESQELEELRRALRELESSAGAHRRTITALDAAIDQAHCSDSLTKAEREHDRVDSLRRDVAELNDHTRELEERAAALAAAESYARARRRVDATRSELDLSEAARRELAEAEAQLEQLEGKSVRLREARARVVAGRKRRDLERARELQARHPNPPRGLVLDDELARTVHTALDRWCDRPAPVEPHQPSADELRRQLEQLPTPPSGDVTPRAEVTDAERDWLVAKGRLDTVLSQPPPTSQGPELPEGVDESQLRRLADDLSVNGESIDPLEALVVDAARKQSRSARSVAVIASAVALALVGTVLGLAGLRPAFALVALGLVVLVFGIRAGNVSRTDDEALASLEQRLAAAKATEATRARATEETRRLGLPDDPVALRRSADSLVTGRLAREQGDVWEREHERLRRESGEAEQALRRVLTDAGVDASGDLAQAVQTYREACSERATQQREADQRVRLEAELRSAETREAEAAATQDTLTALERGLLDAAAQVGLDVDMPTTALEAELAAWSEQRRARLADEQQAQKEWAELQNILDGRPLSELDEQAALAQARADSTKKELQERSLEPLEPGPGHDERRLEQEIEAVDAQLHQAEELVTRARVSAAEQAARAGDLEGAERALRDAFTKLEELAGRDLDVLRALDPDTAAVEVAEAETELTAVRARSAGLAGQIQEKNASLPDLDELRQTLDAAIARRRDAVSAMGETSQESELVGSAEELESRRRHHERQLNEAVHAKDRLEGVIRERERARSDVAVPTARVADAEARLEEMLRSHPDCRDAYDLDALPSPDEMHEAIEALDAVIAGTRDELANVRGQLEERRHRALDPAAAEEQLATAKSDLERVKRLGDTLDLTARFLAAAQDRVHRDIAPRLNSSCDRWMPHLFADRYQRVLVDPESLGVTVLSDGGGSRPARLLSRGTWEQVYLLLRLALVEALTAASEESCPLILDDITVNFDTERKGRVLDLLHHVSRDRQVVLFSQEEAIREWAEDRLVPDHDRLTVLEGRVLT